MLRVGTVFSGIGAIEHALKRMNIEHEIAFACDNGDVDIFSKDISIDMKAIEAEFHELKFKIKEYNAITEEDKIYKQELENDLEQHFHTYNDICNEIDVCLKKYPISYIIKVFENINKQDNLKKTRLKEYTKFEKLLNNQDHKRDWFLKRMQYTVECVNDFKKDNSLNIISNIDEMPSLFNTVELKSTDNIDWEPVLDYLTSAYNILETIQGKKIIKRTRDIAERLGMLHERINLYHLRKKVEAEPNYEKKKKIIDDVYAPYEKQNQVKKSYLANYDVSPKNFHWNVSFLDGKQYADNIDLFVGGSPCQSFSLVGKQRGLEDTRGTLFYEYARLVSEIKPKIFIYENVKAVLSNDNGNTWKTMQKVFDDLGYTWKYQILNAKNYGIPQNRERIFVVGFRNDLVLKQEFNFPAPVELTTTMKDFLLDNVSGKYYLNTKGVDFVTMEKNLTKRYTQINGDVALCQKKNQQFNWHGDFVFVEENTDMEKTMADLDKYFLSEKVRKYVLASGTKNFYSKPKTDLDIARPLLTTMHKMHRAGVDNYVTTDGRLRKLTPRECLRLMGFCDSFKITVSDTAMYQQSGNSIVVDVLIAVMSEIMKCMPVES